MKATLIITTKQGTAIESKKFSIFNKESFIGRIEDDCLKRVILVQTSENEYLGCVVNDIDYFKIIFEE